MRFFAARNALPVATQLAPFPHVVMQVPGVLQARPRSALTSGMISPAVCGLVGGFRASVQNPPTRHPFQQVNIWRFAA